MLQKMSTLYSIAVENSPFFILAKETGITPPKNIASDNKMPLRGKSSESINIFRDRSLYGCDQNAMWPESLSFVF